MLDRAHVREVYAEAAALPEGERAAFLAARCDGDAALRAEVESLLTAAAGRPGFLESPTAAPPPGPGEAPGTRIGPYRLLQEIGQGGFGAVYMAEQEQPVRRRVALKIIKLGMDTRAVIARFEAERQALALMDHAHIARVFDAGATESGRPYFVMELVKGDPIHAYCDRNNLTIPERLELFLQVCRAVQHAHSKGVIHRDLKPSNVLVATQDGRPHAKVIDFGIAKATDHRLTEKTLFTDFRQFVGTPEYMSPEQAQGSLDIDTRSDVYSLGVLLYQLLTGVTPFDPGELRSAAYAEIQRIIREVEPPPPSTRLSKSATLAEVAAHRRIEPGRLSASVRGDLDWIVMRAMEKDRARRYETASALAADIECHLAGEPIEAAPPSRAYRVRKFVRRNKGLAVTVGTAGAALVLGIIGTSIGLVAANTANEAAQASARRATSEAEQTRAINDFMREVLTSVEPQNSGADVRLMDVLANASGAAAERFAGHPLLEAQVHELLGAVYTKLALWEQSKGAAQRSLALFRSHAGPDDPRTLRAEVGVMGAALNLSQVSEAEQSLGGLLPRLEAALGPDDPTTLEARRGLATVHFMRGRPDEAEEVLIALHRHPRLANEDRVQVRILFSLFRVRWSRPPPQDRAERTAHWAGLEALARERLNRALRALGPHSLDSLHAQVNLAEVAIEQGNHRAAAEMCRAVLANSSERLGDCHKVRGEARSVLAVALSALGEADEPAELALRVVACTRNVAGPHPIVLLSDIADALKYVDRAGRAEEGEALAREALALLTTMGAQHGDLAFNIESYIAHFVSMRGRQDEAEELFARLLAAEESVPFTNTRARLYLFHGAHLARRAQFEQAERQLQRAVALQGDILSGTWDQQPDDIVVAFAQLYRAWQKPERVREYEELRERAFGIPAPR